jgi:hypothetical protein
MTMNLVKFRGLGFRGILFLFMTGKTAVKSTGGKVQGAPGKGKSIGAISGGKGAGGKGLGK